ncbi:MAG: LPS export ABC transporter periplasmic protein LptC [Ignavibacterium album]|uniref:LPS export ABC transporter periplasmic protein LptC n=1 Tax=Ignavibacterium album TaxID=591197 RepID=UPI0026F03864|nr:LPS export ABC transporter periplasmic protein LptC [Ignavibacterium album]MBI5663094.1 LPS export ABC transporter periplasmic protein LptC [Ignavibacterium album]
MKISIILLMIGIIGCSGERVKPPIDRSFQDQNIPTQESWNATVTFSDSGKIRAILFAGHIRMYSDKNETLLDSSIKIDFYDINEMKTTTLTSKRGRVDDLTNDLYAFDSVSVESDSIIITTEEMMWRNKDRKIVSDKFVTILSPKEKIQGYGFESDQNLKNYVIYNITYITRRDTL